MGLEQVAGEARGGDWDGTGEPNQTALLAWVQGKQQGGLSDSPSFP